MKEASFSFHNSSLCIGLLSPVTDMRSSGGIDGHKMCLNMFPQKCLEPKTSPCRPDVTRDKQTCLAQRLTWCIFLICLLFPSPLHLFLCSSGFITSRLKHSNEFRIGWVASRDCTAVSSYACVKHASDQVWGEVGRGGG